MIYKANQFINQKKVNCASSSCNILIFEFEAAQIAAVLQIAWYFVSLDYPPFFHEFTERRNTNSNAKYFGKPLPLHVMGVI